MLSSLYHNDFTISGQWSFSTFMGARTINGILSYVANRIVLKLDGQFPARSNPNSEHTIDYLFGRLSDGTKVTAYRLFQTNLNTRSTRGLSAVIQEFLVSEMTVHLWEPKEIFYNKMFFRVPGLETWFNLQYVQIEPEATLASGVPNVEVDFGEAVTICIPDINASIKFQMAWETNKPIATKDPLSNEGFRLVCFVNVIVCPDVPQSKKWYDETLFTLKKFFSFLSGRRFNEANAIGFVGEGNDEYWHFSSGHFDGYASPKNHLDFFMPYENVESDFSLYMNNWYSNGKLKVATDLGFGLFEKNDMWIHLEFLSLMQSLENFHREVVGSQFLDPQSYESIANKIKQSIPESLAGSHKSSLKSRIDYGYEYSLRKRMKELFSNFPAGLRRLIFGDHDKFPSKWIETRNYYTHWDELLKEEILEDSELWDVNDTLKKFLRCLVLLEIGVDSYLLETAAHNK